MFSIFLFTISNTTIANKTTAHSLSVGGVARGAPHTAFRRFFAVKWGYPLPPRSLESWSYGGDYILDTREQRVYRF